MKEQKLKTFVFQDNLTHQSTIKDCQIDNEAQKVNIFPILQSACHPLSHKISLYHPNLNRFTPLLFTPPNIVLIDKLFMEPNFILVRFVKTHPPKASYIRRNEKLKQQRMKFSEFRDKKSKQRTIREAIQAVKQWRQSRSNGRIRRGRKLNLNRAALSVGVSKKTLDDYYCQLRLGEQYQFDFVNNLDSHIGVLRAFIKSQRPEKEQGQHSRYEKHSKDLKMLKYYDLQTHKFVETASMAGEPIILSEQRPLISQYQSQRSGSVGMSSLPLIQPQNRSSKESSQEPEQESSKKLMNIEYEYFRGFRSQEGEPRDVIDDMDEECNKDMYGNNLY